ncbi:hypothetical protein ACMFMG_009294 [Clarireedia jacksonii]
MHYAQRLEAHQFIPRIYDGTFPSPPNFFVMIGISSLWHEHDPRLRDGLHFPNHTQYAAQLPWCHPASSSITTDLSHSAPCSPLTCCMTWSSVAPGSQQIGAR